MIITGGASGAGASTAMALAAQGHSVMIACRTIDEAQRIAAEMHGDVEVRSLDLADLASVRAFADSVESVDVLVNNAGVMGMPFDPHGRRLRGAYGYKPPRAFRIDLSARRSDQRSGRLGRECDIPVQPDSTWLTSTGTRASTRSGARIAQLKLANLLFVRELAALGIRAYASDPGATDTDITRSMGMGEHRGDAPNFCTRPAQGARASLQAVTTDLPSGTYLAPRFNQFGPPKVTKVRPKASDPVYGSPVMGAAPPS